MDINETYQSLLRELKRLTGRELSSSEIMTIWDEYIYSRIPDIEIRKALKGKMKKLVTVSLPEGLNLEPILKQTLKVLALMEATDNWQEFESLANKKKKPDKPKELTDFDKILKGLFQVPKPTKEEPPE